MPIYQKYLEKLKSHPAKKNAREFLRYIGPGLLITVGFIDPGNLASNMAAGADYGYSLLWMVTLSTIMLIILQHNAAHLGIASGQCLSEAAAEHLPSYISRPVLGSAVLASAATALAELLGSAIALHLLFGLPIFLGAFFTALFCIWLLWSNSYNKLEKIIIGFVSLIGLSFLAELCLVQADWPTAGLCAVTPSLPTGSLVIVMSVLGAVVMPHNLFLHSEIIQSRQWNLEEDAAIRRQLRYEFMDTIISMGLGWAINSAMIVIAAVIFFTNNISVTDLAQAVDLLSPLLGQSAYLLFAIALFLAGIASTTTAGMAGASIFAGIFHEPYDIDDLHSRLGVFLTYGLALIILLFLTDPFSGLIYSQMALSIQLPLTIALQLYLTSSHTIMGKYANNTRQKIILSTIGLFVIILNIMLLADMCLS